MIKTIRALALAAGLLLSISTTASAGAINVDAGWYGFCFDGAGSSATAGCVNEGVGTSASPFTFTAAAPVYFQITDAFNAGDTFLVSINSSAYTFTTPSVPQSFLGVTNPDTAFASPDFSHGSQLLPAGAYSVEVSVASSPFSSGGAYLQVISADLAEVPEPATFALLGAGLAAFALLRRRAA